MQGEYALEVANLERSRRCDEGKFKKVNLIEWEKDGDAKDPGEADDDVLGQHPLLVPSPESDDHQLDKFLRSFENLFVPEHLDKVGGEEAECEEEDGVEDGHGEVNNVLVNVLLRHVVRVDREELEAVVPDFSSKHQGTESEGGDEEEESPKEDVVDPQVDPALHVLPHDVSGGRRYRDVPIGRAQVLLKELHCEGLVNKFKRASLVQHRLHLARRLQCEKDSAHRVGGSDRDMDEETI